MDSVFCGLGGLFPLAYTGVLPSETRMSFVLSGWVGLCSLNYERAPSLRLRCTLPSTIELGAALLTTEVFSP